MAFSNVACHWFTFLCAINQAKTMTLEGTLDFNKKFVRWKGTESKQLDKVKKKDFTKNTPEEKSIQAFTSRTNGEITWESKVISFPRSSISTLVRFRHK